MSCTKTAPFELDFERITKVMRDKFSNNIWCLEPESNRHDPFGSQDFKSFHRILSTTRIDSQLFEIFKELLKIGVHRLRGKSCVFEGVLHQNCTNVLSRKLVLRSDFIGQERARCWSVHLKYLEARNDS